PGFSLLTSAASGYGGYVYFSIDNQGTVHYDPTLEGVLSAAGTSTLTINGTTVTIKPSAALTLAAGLNLNYDYAHAYALGPPFSATLLPGNSILVSAASGYGGFVLFSIDNQGHVGYGHELEGVLSGAGTSTLNVNGATITI